MLTFEIMSVHKRCYFSFILLLELVCGILGVLRPRGVSLLNKIFYDPTQQFHCLDGSGSFPFHFVNDDFCDCVDGSDEPGTAACSNGTFNCLNHGHEPVILPSSRVNDGICDCCDSTDEYSSQADCLNHCKELGQQAAAAAKVIYDKFTKGDEIRNIYIKLGKEKKEEYMVLLEELNKQELEATKVKNEKQDQRENAEAKESLILNKEREMRKAQQQRVAAERRLLMENQIKEEADAQKAFEELDLNQDGKITPLEIQTFIRFDYDGDGKVSDNEVQFYMHKKKEMTLNDFLNSGWKIIKPAFTINEFEDQPLPIEPSSDQKTSSEKELNAGRSSTIEKIEIDQAEKDTIIKDAAMARKDFADADKLLRDIQTEIWLLKRKLKADFGEDDEFLVLEPQCFDLSDKKYLYKFCPFDKIVQILKVNKDETLVGVYERWSGPEGNHYQQMKFSRGASCWNGPSRSAEVNMNCGIQNKVLSVVESSPCSYIFEFETPAMCKEVPEGVRKVLDNELVFI